MHDAKRAVLDTSRCVDSCLCPMRWAAGLLTMYSMQEGSLLQICVAESLAPDRTACCA